MRKKEERTPVRAFTTDPDGTIPRDGCELMLMAWPDGSLRFAWFDTAHMTGGNRTMDRETARRMRDALDAYLGGHEPW